MSRPLSYTIKPLDLSSRSPLSGASPDLTKLHQRQCKFFKSGRCNWGWGCRFLHGNSQLDDPRRSEYRGPAVDFTIFPRPVVFSPFVGPCDQSRVKTLRNPVVEVISSCEVKVNEANNIKHLLNRGNIDILSNGKERHVTWNEVKTSFDPSRSDYVLYVGQTDSLVFPGSISVNQNNVARVIMNKWNVATHNLDASMLDLYSSAEIEKLIFDLSNVDKIGVTTSALMDETSDAISSSATVGCLYSSQMLNTLQNRLSQFFSKLCLANSIITDKPTYDSSSEPIDGRVVSHSGPKPDGLSSEVQKFLSFILSQYMTQIHTCLFHVHRLMGEVRSNHVYPSPGNSSVGLHPTPLCLPSCSQICERDQHQTRSSDKRLEPSVNVDLQTDYQQISFRKDNDMFLNSPFSSKKGDGF